MIRVLRVLEYEFATQEDYDKQFNSHHKSNFVPLMGEYSPSRGLTIKSAIFMPTVEKDESE